MAMIALALVLTLAVAAIIAAFLLPIGVGEINANENLNITQNESETVTLQGPVDATLDSVDDVANEINLTVNDTSTAGSAQITNLGVGASETVTVSGSEVNVTNHEVIDATTAQVEYDYEKSLGWSGGADSLWGILDMIIVLGLFLFFVGVALASAGRV